MPASLSDFLPAKAMNRDLSLIFLRRRIKIEYPQEKIVLTCIAVAGLALVSGCADFAKESAKTSLDPLKSTGRITTTAAHQLFKEDSFEEVFLPVLLDPSMRNVPDIRSEIGANASNTLGQAFENFYKRGNLTKRRNRIQDRLLAAAEQRCNTYKNYLKRVETFQSTETGILTTILAGAGAIATGTTNSRAFAGLAGISNGVGAELKSGFFADLSSQIIVPGIELRRKKILEEITAKRRKSITQYTVEAALRDVALYHGACSMIVGLEESGIAIKTFQNPGLDSINDTLTKLRYTKGAMDNLQKPTSAAEMRKEIRTLDTEPFTEESYGTTEDMPIEILQGMIGELRANFDELTQEIKAQYETTNPAPVGTVLAQLKKWLGSDENSIQQKYRIPALAALYNQLAAFGKDDARLAELQFKDESLNGNEKIKIQSCIANAQRDAKVLHILPARSYVDNVIDELTLAKKQIKSGLFDESNPPLQSIAALATSGVIAASAVTPIDNDESCK